jgi:putative hydrolase of the HAD superfamily
MADPPTRKALLVDALGTTVRLPPPWERLDRSLTAGLEPDRVREAFEAEMSHYAAHAHEARDEDSLASLRRDCAAILSEGLGRDVGVEPMMAAIAFEAYPDAPGTLAELRSRGLAIVCVSNWDYELEAVLERVGLLRYMRGVVASALAGARKPDPAIFERARELAGCDAAEALHVGDSDDDVEGARAAGIEVLRIDRTGDAGDLRTLAELPALAIGEHDRP